MSTVGNAEKRYQLIYIDPRRNFQMVAEDLLGASDVLPRICQIRRELSHLLEDALGIVVVSENGHELTIGLGEEECIVVVTYTRDEEPWEQFVTLGDAEATGTAAYYLPEWTEVDRSSLVPCNLAMRALSTWLDDESLDPALTWTNSG